MQLQVADVVGDGGSSPTIAACVRTLLRTVIQDTDHRRLTHQATDRAVEGVGVLLGGTGTFVTVFGVALDLATGTLAYVLVGPGLAVVLDADGGHHRLTSSGPALGLSPSYGTGWEVRTTVVAPGQTLLVLGDGFLDLDPDPQKQLDRTLERVTERYQGGIGVHQAVELTTAWAVTQGHRIDITVLALRRNPGLMPGGRTTERRG
ncbi:SpoIIE family protein phosphatase [Kocuria sabuli]|uniref:SpoIIE family protein phosphatase n=1 Tax=Kocuria sabuli TaxID=3071448 RepID=UPI0034D4EF33